MPRTQIPVDTSSDSGAAFSIDTAGDAVNGHYFINSGNELLFVENTDVGSITVTIDYVTDPYGRDGTKTVTVAAGVTKVIGPFKKDLYNQSGEQVHVDVSGGTFNVAVVGK